MTYLDNDTELRIVTPNSLIYGYSIRTPEHEFDDDDTNINQAAWDRWKNDYLKGLHERHDMKHKPSKNELTVSEKCPMSQSNMIKRTEKRGKSELFIQLFKRQDGFVREVLLPPGKS